MTVLLCGSSSLSVEEPFSFLSSTSFDNYGFENHVESWPYVQDTSGYCNKPQGFHALLDFFAPLGGRVGPNRLGSLKKRTMNHRTSHSPSDNATWIPATLTTILPRNFQPRTHHDFLLFGFICLFILFLPFLFLLCTQHWTYSSLQLALLLDVGLSPFVFSFSDLSCFYSKGLYSSLIS